MTEIQNFHPIPSMDFLFQHVVDAIEFLTIELSILVNSQDDNYVAKIENCRLFATNISSRTIELIRKMDQIQFPWRDGKFPAHLTGSKYITLLYSSIYGLTRYPFHQQQELHPRPR